MMNNPRTLKIVVTALVVAFCVAVGLLARAIADNFSWRLQVENLAQWEGATVARQDFESGRLRLFVISGKRDEDRFSGTNEGPFEVWYSSYFPEIRAFRCAAETRVATYNAKMRYMQQHPDRYLERTNTTIPKVLP